MMMELFLMTLVIPIFGVFGALMGGLVKNLGLGKLVKKDGLPVLPPPVGGILPTVAYLFQQRAKAKQGQTQQGGSMPQQTGNTDTTVSLLRKLLEAQSNNPSWIGRQLFGQQRMRDSGRTNLDGDGFWSKTIEEVVRKYRGGQ